MSELFFPLKNDDVMMLDKQKEAQFEKVVQINPAEISDFPNHPFQVKQDDAMAEMVESIRTYGVLVPALVRPRAEGGYEMIAGHRRKFAAVLAEVSKIPCVVRNLTDDEAIIVMVDSNLQREKLLPSEKAFAYKMKLEAMKRQGARSDLTSATLLQKSAAKTSREILAEQAGESHEQVRKYIRLTFLIPELLQKVDDEKVAMSPAVEVSYLSEKEQRALLDIMELEERTPSVVQAKKLKRFSQDGKLNDEVILSILQEEKPNEKEQLKIPIERIRKYFLPGTPVPKIEETIIKALKIYHKRQRDRER